MSIKLRPAALLAMVFATMLGSLSAMGATSDPAAEGSGDLDGSSSDSDERLEDALASLDVLRPLAQKILALVEDPETERLNTTDGPYAGYTGVVISALSGTVEIHWKGQPPEDIRALVAEHPAAKVVWHEAEYSAIDVESAQGAVDEFVRVEGGLGDNVELIAILHGPDWQYLEVVLATPGAQALDDMDLSRLKGVTLVPLVVRTVDSAESDARFLASRQDDSTPWLGGSQVSMAGRWCSSGYPVKMNGTGNEYLTTAFHCIDGAGSTGSVKDGAGDPLGVWKNQSSWNRKSYDATLIKPSSGVVGSQVYRGNAWSTLNVGLSAAATSTVGDWVCINGANSGAHCLVEVLAKNEGFYGIDGTPLAGHVRAGHVDAGATAAVSGDSGGPIYQLKGSSYYGLGTISQGVSGTKVTCNSAQIAHPSGVSCFRQIVYKSLTGLLSSLDASLN